MPLGTTTVAQPGFQDEPLCFPNVSIVVVNQSGAQLTAGNVRRFNTQFSDGAALPSGSASGISAEEGDFAGMWCVIQDDTADTAAHDSVVMVCVIDETIADGDHGKATIRGIVTADINDAVALPSGFGLSHGVTANHLTPVVGAGNRIVAELLGVTAGAAGGDVQRSVRLDGVRGLGRSKNA